MRCYPYECNKCRKEWDVYKPLADIDRKEVCLCCGSDDTIRRIALTNFFGADDWDKAEYNPAFGKVIRNRKHRDAEAKARGMIEIGNEKTEDIHKSADKTLNDNRDAAYAALDKEDIRIG